VSNVIDATMPPPDRRLPTAKPISALIDILIVFAISALAFAVEDFANTQGWVAVGADVRGVSSVLAGALAAVAVVLARGGTLSDLGFRRPTCWARVPFQVAAILAVFVAAQRLVPLLVSSFITVPAPDLSRYASIAGNLHAALIMALVLPLTASIPEEIIYRGFLIGRLSSVFAANTAGAVLAVLTQALVFGAVHFQWGIGGMIVTVVMGLVWGAGYLLCGRNLWVVILAHSAGHILLVTQLYLADSLVL
jgi:membrane protease YdiL (CAAX protease family)